MKKYNFHNKEYGIKLSLELDENKEELRYQCFGIKDKYEGNFEYSCKNGWRVTSDAYPFINHDIRAIFLRGYGRIHDNYIVVMRNNETCAIDGVDGVSERSCFPICDIYKNITQVYYEIIEALEELGNDIENQGRLFLDM